MNPRVPRLGRRRRRRDRKLGEEGLAEFVVCFPAFFALLLAGIQFALWSNASHLARAAAEQGSQVASGFGSTEADGTAAATSFLATTDAGTITNPQVSTTTVGGDIAQVTVTGQTKAIIPWLTFSVSATSNAPIQKFRTN